MGSTSSSDNSAVATGLAPAVATAWATDSIPISSGELPQASKLHD